MIKLFLLILAFSAPCVLSLQSFGLFPTSTDHPPLELLKLETQVKVEGESYARIQYDFIYKNPFDNTIQTKFVFPPTKNAIFYKFEATIQNQTFTSKVVKQSDDEDLETDNCDPSGFPMIPPNETVHIIFVIIQPLQVILSKFYELKLEAFNDSNDTHWNIQIELESIDEFVVLSNPTHRLLPTLSEQNNIHRAFWNVTVAPNKEFAVYFGPEDLKNYTIHLPDANMRLYNVVPNVKSVSAQEAQNMLENIPDAVLKMKKSATQSEMKKSKTTCFFVLDRSDSMEGSPMQLLKKTLKVLLHDFASYCKDFHMISFGSSFQHHNHAQSLAGFKDIQKTIKWVDTIEADMGGSDLLKALNYIDGLPSSGDPKITIILTDGDVTEPYQVKWGHYFVVGIGEASKSRTKYMSYQRISGREFVTDHKEFGDQEVVSMLQKANEIYLECAFTFSTTDDPYHKRPFFKSNRYWYRFSEDDAVFKMYFSSNTNLKICDGYHEWDGLESLFSRKNSVFEVHTKSVTEMWQTLEYVDKIKELENVYDSCDNCDDEIADNLQERMIDLCLQHQILPYWHQTLAYWWTSLVLQTKSDVRNVCSSEFFDLSKFNKSPPFSYYDPREIPKDYIPLDSIQNAEKNADEAVSSQTVSIDL